MSSSSSSGAGFPPEQRLVLTPEAERFAVDRLAALEIEGGAVYDGLIALVAAEVDAELVSFDRRAAVTYRRCGVAVRSTASGR